MEFGYVILNYPDHTTVKIEGNSEIIKQIIERLDGQTIEYTIGKLYGVEIKAKKEVKK